MKNGVSNWTHGPSFEEDAIRFRFWAPGQERVGLVIDGRDEPVAMTPAADGFFETVVKDLRAGARYRFQLSGGERVPDPASRFQPDDVNGPSEAIDPRAYRWRESWPGRQWHDIVLYELHVGAFSPEGSFAGAAAKLGHLARLGVTAVEIMPVSAFSGRRNWGYDGAFPYAPDASYGRPEDFKAFIEAAHAHRGIAVVAATSFTATFGPEGNFLPLYAPDFFTSRHRTSVGRRNPIRRTELPSDFATSSSRTPNIGSRNFISTDSASTPSTPSRTTRGQTCSTNSPRGFARVFGGLSIWCWKTRATIHAIWRAMAAMPIATPRNGTTTFTTCCMLRRRRRAAVTMPPMAAPSFWEEPSPKASPIRAR